MVGGRPTGDRQVTVRTPSIGRSLPGRRPEKLLRIYQIFREIARGPIGDQQGTAQASVGFNSLLNFSKRSPSVLYVQRRPSVLTDRPVAVLKCDLSLREGTVVGQILKSALNLMKYVFIGVKGRT